MNHKNIGYAALRITAATLGAVALLALGGCAEKGEPVKETVETPDLVWPLPPEEPRIRYVRSISSDKDIGANKEGSVTGTLFGEKAPEAEQRIRKPYSVHADKNGRIFVGDTSWGKLLVFDVANSTFDIWGKGGKGGLQKPLGITSDSQGRVYVTDGIAKRVVVYDQDGEFLFAAGREGELERPVGIVVNEALGRIYVADTARHHIAVFDMAGNHTSTIGERGSEPGQFNFPTNLTIDHDGKLFVVDMMNFRVQILDPQGKLLRSFGQNGKTPGSFSRAKGIAVDSEGHIYVVDSAFNNVQIFDSEGVLLLYIGENGNGPGEFWLPAGSYVDAQDRLYIADQFNSRIQIFQYLGEHTETPAAASVPAETPSQ